MSELKMTLEIVGGLAVLLYGINLLGVNLQRILGSRLEEVLKRTGNNPIKGLAIGTGITGIIQSSGTTIVMLFGFIGAGLMSLKGAVPVMLGANIGSTVTTQLASFQMGIYTMPILTAGFLIYIISVSRIYKSLGEAVMGLGFLFLGMSFIFDGVGFLSDDQTVVNFIGIINSYGIFAVMAAAVFTLIVQSSSATSVFVVALAVAQIVSLESALFLILGTNLGSSLKVILLALRGKSFSGKLALMHLLFNMFGLFVFLLFFKYFYYLVNATSGDVGRQVANAHTLYNIINALIFIPFIPLIVGVIDRYVPSGKIERSKLFYLDRKLLYTPSMALSQVNRAVVEMAKISYEMLENSRSIFNDGRTKLIGEIVKGEQSIDKMTDRVSEYTVQISQQNLSKKDSMKLYSLMHILTDIEHLSDHILATGKLLGEAQERKIYFSSEAVRELNAIFGKLKIMQNLVIKSLEEDNLNLAYEIIKHENKVDEIVKKVNNNHLGRIKKGVCSMESSRYFSEILNNLERIGDHYDNIAYAVVDRFKYK
jgi:phosphate:Na+ symporter